MCSSLLSPCRRVGVGESEMNTFHKRMPIKFKKNTTTTSSTPCFDTLEDQLKAGLIKFSSSLLFNFLIDLLRPTRENDVQTKFVKPQNTYPSTWGPPFWHVKIRDFLPHGGPQLRTPNSRYHKIQINPTAIKSVVQVHSAMHPFVINTLVSYLLYTFNDI